MRFLLHDPFYTIKRREPNMGNSFLNLGAILESEQAFQSMKNVFAKSVNDTFLSTAIQEMSSLNEELKDIDLKAFKLIKEA